jgi:hypothetical protein
VCLEITQPRGAQGFKPGAPNSKSYLLHTMPDLSGDWPEAL